MKMRLLAALAAPLLLAAPAQAGTGDIHEVKAERLNVRADPSNDANVRTQIQQGARVMEVGSQDGWVGVRVMSTGEEGWVFGRYLEPISRSTLGGEAEQGPFATISSSFDRVFEGINEQIGTRTVARVEQVGEDTLHVTPTEHWLRNGSHDAHLMSAVSFYQVWKDHRDGGDVELVLLDQSGEPYIRIKDETDGPVVSVPSEEPKG